MSSLMSHPFHMLSMAPLPLRWILSFWMLLTLCQCLSVLCPSFLLQVPPPHNHVRLRLMVIQMVQQRMMCSQLIPHPRTHPRTCWASPPRPHSHVRPPGRTSSPHSHVRHRLLHLAMCRALQPSRAALRLAPRRCPSSRRLLPGRLRSAPSPRSTRAGLDLLRHRPAASTSATSTAPPVRAAPVPLPKGAVAVPP